MGCQDSSERSPCTWELVAIIVEAPGCTKLQTSIYNTHRLLQNKKHLNIVSVVIKAFLLLDNV